MDLIEKYLCSTRRRESDQRDFVHVIDAEGKIVIVNNHWLAFAAENGASITRDNVIGRDIWSSMDNPVVVNVYRHAVQRVISDHKKYQIPYRCDSPNEARWFLLDMRRVDDSKVEFRNRMIRAEPRQSIRLLESGVPRSGSLIVMCSWCKKIRQDGRWLELDQAITVLRLFETRLLPAISHGACEECVDRILGTKGKVNESLGCR